MKSEKICSAATLLLLLIIMVPMSALCDSRDGAVANPIDDQPWGGEIDATDYARSDIYSTGGTTYPEPLYPISIGYLGTPFGFIDYFKNLFSIRPAAASNTSNCYQVKMRTESRVRTETTSYIMTKRTLLRKGR